LGEAAIIDVYLNTRRALLVVKKGCPIPVAMSGRWRKSKKRIVAVSEEIKSAIQTQGYYMRKLRDLPANGGTESVALSTDVQSLQHHN
jgi:hypothetical protein